MACGVYVIENGPNGKKYVGSSGNLARRRSVHWTCLRANKHHAVKLQRAWNKYGPQAFTFKILLLCSQDNALMYEQRAIEEYAAVADGYNTLPTAGSRLGSPHAESVRAGMVRFQRSRAKKYQWNGKSLCLAEIAEEIGLPFKVLAYRVLEAKWDLAKATAKPYRPNRNRQQIESDRRTRQKRMPLNELSALLGFPKHTISQRLHCGWSLMDAVMAPLPPNKRRL